MVITIDKRVRKNNVQRIIETVFRPSIPWKNHSCYGRVFYMLVCGTDVWVIWGVFASQTASWLVSGAETSTTRCYFVLSIDWYRFHCDQLSNE